MARRIYLSCYERPDGRVTTTEEENDMKTSKPERFVSALILTTVLALGLTVAGTSAAEAHPEKAIYADRQSWPATAPGTVKLSGFRPFRATYDREYTQASGPGAGEKRQDRIIVHAESVGWDGVNAAVITVIDSGAARFADTNMRTLTMVTALDDLRVLFEIGPIPGKAKDYYLARFTEDSVLISSVMTDTQTLQPRKVPTGQAGFGPGSWVMASMKLEEGLKINLAPYFSPQANPISQTSYGRVVDRETMTDGSGNEHEAWVVETGGWYGPESPKVLRLYLKSAPPYYLGTEIFNHDTGEGKRFVWLRDAQLMAP